MAPELSSTINVSRQKLFAAIAKTQALSHSSESVRRTLQRAARELVKAVVDDSSTEFHLSEEAEMIEMTARTALAGTIGAGVCHLYMESIGYAWLAHVKEHLSVSANVATPDFIYAGGAADAASGYVVAEAKGSFATDINKARIRNKSELAYDNQVGDYVGATHKIKGYPILHGYGIAFGTRLASLRNGANSPHSFLHVTETGHANVAKSQRALPNKGSVTRVGIWLALENYRANFLLARAPVLVDAIDNALAGADQPLSHVQRFTKIRTEFGTFITGRVPRNYQLSKVSPIRSSAQFAVEEGTAKKFLDLLSRFSRTAVRIISDDDAFIELESLALDDSEVANAPVMLADGLCLIALRANDETTVASWSHRTGYVAWS